MQALYAYFQHEKGDAIVFEKNLFQSIDKIHELYLSILCLISDIHHVALIIIDEHKNKHLPTKDDLAPNLKFANNSLLVSIASNKEFAKQLEKRKISWQGDFDVVRKLFQEIKSSEAYANYMQSKTSSFIEDRDFLIEVITEHLSENELLMSLFEEKNMYWVDDAFVAFNSVIRNFESFDGEFKLMPLLRHEKDDIEFTSQLFKKTIMFHAEYHDLIAKHTQNWEVERIANIDMLLMEMALTEILHIPKVPVKASLNEYIDISKEYSTPNSKVFVNGVLDKVIAELRRDDKITKEGRGLKEN